MTEHRQGSEVLLKYDGISGGIAKGGWIRRWYKKRRNTVFGSLKNWLKVVFLFNVSQQNENLNEILFQPLTNSLISPAQDYSFCDRMCYLYEMHPLHQSSLFFLASLSCPSRINVNDTMKYQKQILWNYFLYKWSFRFEELITTLAMRWRPVIKMAVKKLDTFWKSFRFLQHILVYFLFFLKM